MAVAGSVICGIMSLQGRSLEPTKEDQRDIRLNSQAHLGIAQVMIEKIVHLRRQISNGHFRRKKGLVYKTIAMPDGHRLREGY